MQTKKEQLTRQQEILKGLGFYTGKIDGIWGPESIKAMKRFEAQPAIFLPGRPNHGMPLSDIPPHPAGFYLRKGLFHHACIDKKEIKSNDTPITPVESVHVTNTKSEESIQVNFESPKKKSSS